MRVLHVGKYYPPVPGGMERVLQLLCESERATVDSRVLVASTSRTTSHEVVRGVPVTRAGSLAMIGSVALSAALPFELRREAVDITVIHEPNPVALVADFITRRRGPLLVYFHSEVVRAHWKYKLLYWPFLRRVLDRAARIIVASPPMAETAVQLSDHRDKCVVVPYGIDIATFEMTTELKARVAAIRAGSPLPLLLFVGRLVPYKGVDVLVRAMVDTAARLVIIGDGPVRASLEQLASDLGVAGRVSFAGTLPDPDVVAHYHACDVFVLPSVTRAEAFGMVQVEAMACGKPVISTDLPSGVPWVNRHDGSGLVVPPGNVERLREAIGTLLRDEPLRARLGAGARQRVARDFTAQRMAERTVALYREVLREQEAGARTRTTGGFTQA
jgi:glycosyltransferase involved in cell wall biosynthesis